MKFTLIAFLSLLFGACQPTDFVKTIPADEFAQYITEEGVQLLDVRTPEEYAEGHLDGATSERQACCSLLSWWTS